jgi:hypothetical protein
MVQTFHVEVPGQAFWYKIVKRCIKSHLFHKKSTKMAERDDSKINVVQIDGLVRFLT